MATYLICRNRVKDFDRWKAAFDADMTRGEAAGLHLAGMWQDKEDDNNVFFNFEVEDVDRAIAFMNSPESAELGETSGVIDGEVHFAESVP